MKFMDVIKNIYFSYSYVSAIIWFANEKNKEGIYHGRKGTY